MVPLTEVAFMPGTIAGESVMVGLGQDYYVERTPREAQAVLERRMAGACVREKPRLEPGGQRFDPKEVYFEVLATMVYRS